jgi:hypothetical protein
MARPGVARRYGAIDGAFADAKPGQPVTDSACEIHEAPYPQSRSCEPPIHDSRVPSSTAFRRSKPGQKSYDYSSMISLSLLQRQSVKIQTLHQI